MIARAVPLVLLGAIFESGCRLLGPGYIGPIQPPALEIPVSVSDIRAIEYGNEILVGFSVSSLSTEGLPLKTLRSVDLYAGAGGPGSGEPITWSKTATHYSVPAKMPGPFEYRFPAQAWINKDVVIRVRATGPKGRTSQWSIPFAMTVVAPVSRPLDLKAESRKDGVHLTWQAAGPKFRVLRSTGDEAPQPIGGPDKPEFIDGSAQFGMTYRYMVLAYTDDQHQSLTSEPVTLMMPAKDIFPPEVPTGVTATASPNAIDLDWDISTEADFKGYNVFRSVDNGPFEKVVSLLPAATYHDTSVQAGKTYRYQVSAVDVSDNESERSAPVSVTLQ